MIDDINEPQTTCSLSPSVGISNPHPPSTSVNIESTRGQETIVSAWKADLETVSSVEEEDKSKFTAIFR